MSTPILRPIRVADLPAIFAIYERQIAALGVDEKEFPFPDPREPWIFQAGVGELDGEIIGASFFEAEAEVQFIADNPQFVELMRHEQYRMESILRLRNFKTLRAFIPKHLGQIGAMRRKGFAYMNPDWNCFVKTL